MDHLNRGTLEMALMSYGLICKRVACWEEVRATRYNNEPLSRILEFLFGPAVHLLDMNMSALLVLRERTPADLLTGCLRFCMGLTPARLDMNMSLQMDHY